MNIFGHNFRLAIWGESHGPQIGISIDGVPAGIPLSAEDFEADRSGMDERLRRQLERKARTAKYTTQYELKTKLIRYGLSLGYDYETVVEAASGLVTDTETCDEF